MPQNIRPAMFAGSFYPADASKLKEQINFYLSKVNSKQDINPRAILVPHAGYIFSASVAAEAFIFLENNKKIIIILPARHFPI